MIDKQRLCKFLVKAKKATYAAGETSKKIVEDDKSTTLIFEDGDLKYHDNYFGGEPFGGREVVFLQNEPIYIMTYYGLVDESVSDFEAVYKILQKALSLIPEDHPYRGPKEYIEDGLIYKNSYTGEIDNFFGEETISSAGGNEIYKAKYNGGFVNQRK
ncbi:MAG: hypothetical protein AUJ34_00805 [Parcubacteria group bacterium CG1_02_41_12]|nr:MAG: hypothetical protein AUJ34_00805 [Parcubacteria group bacterium CG1_02_41_12]PIP67200.1 MAG: hypothetical protein COW93_01435 [Parcubacteria group bacterium CG22_combo_CG10-13_8_21_14_all_41_9]PIZ81432.1 MAG: hypothetical protein COY02_02070 [Parcubacteria group bacterium CG_4_10_14_0_2_um_filter_41_6]